MTSWVVRLPFLTANLDNSSQLHMIGGISIGFYACSSPPASMTSFLTRQRNLDERLSAVYSSWFFRLVVLTVPAALLWLSDPPLLPQPLTEPYTHPNLPLRILSSIPSVTGRIVVGEFLPSDSWVPGTSGQYPTSFRYLRASHSILGGVWIGDNVSTRDNSGPTLDAAGTPLGDSIYSAFVLQEAVRLIDTSDRAVRSGQEKALFMYAPVSTLHYPSKARYLIVVWEPVSRPPLLRGRTST